MWDDAVSTSFITDKLQKGAPDAVHFVIMNGAGRALDLAALKNAANGLAVQKAPSHMLLAFAAGRNEEIRKKGVARSFVGNLAKQITRPDVVAQDICEQPPAKAGGF